MGDHRVVERNTLIGVVPGVPKSAVLQSSKPLQTPTNPNGQIVTTFFHVAVGVTTVQASFTCIDCPQGQIGTDQTAIFNSFLNTLTARLPTPT